MTKPKRRYYLLGVHGDHFKEEDPIIVCCCKDGTISYHERGVPPFNGVALPVLSVRNEQEAKDLQVLTCRLQKVPHPDMKPGDPWFTIGSGPFSMGFSGEVEDLVDVSDYLTEMLERIRARPSRRTG